MQSNKAAAVVLRRGPKILGFVRSDNQEIGLPCGGIQEGETPEQAAVRECYEETGYHVKVSGGPYVGFCDGALVYTFLVEEDGDSEAPTHPHEGTPAWVSPRELTKGLYGHYNMQVFKQFEIE